MIVLGGGHIAKPVCEFAAKVGFAVTVCDDRSKFASRECFPLAEHVICDSFQNAIRNLHVTPMDYVVVSQLGQVTGSIGGGCSEGEVIREAIKLIGTGTYKTYEIDLTGDVAESEGMVCGGIMRVLVEDDV